MIRRQELNPKTTTETFVTQRQCTYGFMSKHIYIHSIDFEADAIVVQINFASEKVSCSSTLLSAAAQTLSVCTCQQRADTNRKS